MLLYYFLLAYQKRFSINHNIVIFYLYIWKIMSFIACSLCIILNAKTKSLFTLWKLGSTKWFKFEFCANNSDFDRYLFQLTILLKPHFNCWSNLALSWVDKVTTKFCFSYCKCCTLICIGGINYNTIRWPSQNKINFTVN